MATKAQKAEQAEAIAQLRTWIQPGDTVYTILDHVSASGMSRAIRVVLPTLTGKSIESVPPGGKPTDYVPRNGINVDFIHPNWAIGRALGLRHWKRNGREQDALLIGGCGMDMGFHLVYELSHVLYGSGYACLGKGKCPSSYHVNHRDTIRCEGTRVHNPDGPDHGRYCWAPSSWNGSDPIPEDWPRTKRTIKGAIIKGQPLRVVSGEGEPYIICPTCKGVGSLPNPEGPERFDLTHIDGYALRHRWM